MELSTSSISNEIDKSIQEEFSVSEAAIDEIKRRREKGQKPESISNEEIRKGDPIQYCPREQAEGAPAGKWMDIYAWALTVLEMYVGKRLWDTGAEAKENCEEYFKQCRALPSGMKELIDSCLAGEMDDFSRFETLLKKEYRKICGKEYPKPDSKAAFDTADSLNNRALSFLDLKKTDQATKLWEQAAEKDTSNGVVAANKALHLWNIGELTDESVLEILLKEYKRTENEIIKKNLFAFAAGTNHILDASGELFQLIKAESSLPTPTYIDRRLVLENVLIQAAVFINSALVLLGGKGFLCVKNMEENGRKSERYLTQEDLENYSGMSPSICTFEHFYRDNENHCIECLGYSQFRGYFRMVLDQDTLKVLTLDDTDYNSNRKRKILSDDRFGIVSSDSRVRVSGKTSRRCLRSIPGTYCSDIRENGLALVVEGHGAVRVLQLPEDKPADTFIVSKAVSTAVSLQNEDYAEYLITTIQNLIQEQEYAAAAGKLNSLREIPGYEMTDRVLHEEAILHGNCFAEALSYAAQYTPESAERAERAQWNEHCQKEKKKYDILKKQILAKTRNVRYTAWGDRAEHKCISFTPLCYLSPLPIFAVSAAYRKTGQYGSDFCKTVEIYQFHDNLAQQLVCFDQTTQDWKRRIAFSKDGRKKAVQWDGRAGELEISRLNGDGRRVVLQYEGEISDLVFSPDSRFLAVIGSCLAR